MEAVSATDLDLRITKEASTPTVVINTNLLTLFIVLVNALDFKIYDKDNKHQFSP